MPGDKVQEMEASGERGEHLGLSPDGEGADAAAASSSWDLDLRYASPARSLRFWSGLLGLLFLGWAWADSLKHAMSLQWGYWGLYHDKSGVAVACKQGPTSWGPRPKFSRDAFPAHVKATPEMRGVRLLRDTHFSRFHLSVGHGTLICVGVMLWGMSLYGRWKWIRKTNAEHRTSNAEF